MTSTPMLDAITHLRFPDVDWSEVDRPVLIADGRLYHVKDLDTEIAAEGAFVVGVRQDSFDRLTRYLRAKAVHFYDMRVEDISSIERIGSIEALGLEWNTKLASLEPVAGLKDLLTLAIIDTPKVRDLDPVGRLARLRAFEYSGGIWNKITAATLEPLARLSYLEELRLTNLAVVDGGLRPLAGCTALRRLDVSNQFPTADYAYLSVALPDTACDYFAPYVPLDGDMDGRDVMVVGSRKPFLDSTKDATRLQAYVADFERLQKEFAAGS